MAGNASTRETAARCVAACLARVSRDPRESEELSGLLLGEWSGVLTRGVALWVRRERGEGDGDVNTGDEVNGDVNTGDGDEVIKDGVDHTLNDTVNDTVNDTLNDSINDTLNDTLNDSINNTLNDTLIDTIHEIDRSNDYEEKNRIEDPTIHRSDSRLRETPLHSLHEPNTTSQNSPYFPLATSLWNTILQTPSLAPRITPRTPWVSLPSSPPPPRPFSFPASPLFPPSPPSSRHLPPRSLPRGYSATVSPLESFPPIPRGFQSTPPTRSRRRFGFRSRHLRRHHPIPRGNPPHHHQLILAGIGTRRSRR